MNFCCDIAILFYIFQWKVALIILLVSINWTTQPKTVHKKMFNYKKSNLNKKMFG